MPIGIEFGVKSSAILCLSYEYPPLGGRGSRVVFGLTRALAAAGKRVDLLTMGYGDLPALESAAGMDIRRIGHSRTRTHMCSAIEMIPYLIAATFHSVRAARANRYSLNHSHFIFPDGIVAYLLKKATGLKYIITAHGTDVPNYNPDRFGLLHKLLRPPWIAITSQAECIVCPSRADGHQNVSLPGSAAPVYGPDSGATWRIPPLNSRDSMKLRVFSCFHRKRKISPSY